MVPYKRQFFEMIIDKTLKFCKCVSKGFVIYNSKFQNKSDKNSGYMKENVRWRFRTSD